MCPMCLGALRASRTRPILFDRHVFRYKRCLRCKSLICSPMPDDDVLSTMYGSEYGSAEMDQYDVDSPRDTAAILAFLNTQPAGNILDFGCGEGDLLMAIRAETQWTPVGVELDPAVAAHAMARSGAEVMTYGELCDGPTRRFQAVHLGDVIEHLTELNTQLALLLGLLEGGGYLLAEGPLQCGPALFEGVIQASQALRSSVPVHAPPHHVIQATANGQRSLFERYKLHEEEFEMYEVDWPAPSRLRRQDLSHPRTITLYALRRLSVRLSPWLSWGNRYRYIGAIAPHGGPPAAP